VRSGTSLRDFQWFNQPSPARAINVGAEMGGDTLALCLMQEAVHRRHGVQMRVAKEVSDDMVLTDMGDLQFSDVAWPAESVEVFFEDPTLPTILVSKASNGEIERLIEGFTITGGVKEEERVISRIDKKGGYVLINNLKESLWNELFIRGESMHIRGGLKLEPSEEKAMAFMLRLAFKVFAYASLPKYVPEKIVSPITRSMGGKSGYKGRPHRPAMRVVYLPAVHTARKDDQARDNTDETVSYVVVPHDRRGYFRIYRHDRFKHMKGKRQFIAPVRIHGGALEGGHKVFVVKK
jgi:hypothetical protein